ncbi:acetyl-CoA hydrolase/transferase family protein [Chloroflexota bacterium]
MNSTPLNWQEEYEGKIVSAEEAASIVKSGDRVSITYGREPRSAGLALAARLGEIQDIRVFVRTPSIDFGWYDSGWESSFNIDISYVLPIVREMAAQRRCDFVIGGVQGIIPEHPVVSEVDVLLTEVSTPDKHGYCSFGASVWGKKRAIQNAKKIIAEVNPNLIRTYGDNYIHISEIDYFVKHTPSGQPPGGTDLLGRTTREPGEVESNISNLVSTIIKDGNTLQIGVGSTSEWVVKTGALNNKLDLGWHSETTPQGIIKLVIDGVITGKYKQIDQGKVVALAIGGGTKEEMDFVDGNPTFELYDADYVLDPKIIGSNDNVSAINSIISVDLTGQIAAESIGPAMVSGPGGQLAFAIGAQMSKNGQYICTMPSTAKDGTLSRIVPLLAQGTIVTVPRTLADIVVSEYGIARLKGKSQRERSIELISIAHPDFRTELKKQAERLYWP